MSDLIDLKQMADLLAINHNYLRDKVVKRPDFPEPALTLSQRVRRWRRVDVEAWAKIHGSDGRRQPAVAALLRPA